MRHLEGIRELGLATALLFVTPAAGAEEEATPCEDSKQCRARFGNGSVCTTGRCEPYRDETDLFIAVGLTEKQQALPKAYEPLLAVLPAFAYNPTVGFLFGGVGIFGIYLGDPDTTTISSMQAMVLYTTKNQFITQVSSTIMTEHNTWEFQGDWRFMIFNQDTFGLGSGHSPVSQGFTINGIGNTAPVEGAQHMDMNLLRFRQNALRNVWNALYIGPGISFDRYYGIVDQRLDLSASPPVVTSHYAYSSLEGFGTKAYNTSGLSLNFLYDTRDSTINAYRGVYASLSYQWNPTWFGSSQDSSFVSAEVRTYLGLSPSVPRNVLAFWVIAQGQLTGALPYLALPSIGWDAKNRTGRGWVQGRFRGTSEIYAEAEWRFRITDNGLLGGVVFANLSTFTRPPVSVPGYSEAGESLFEHPRVAGGVGLRIMQNRQSRTNITLDLTVADKTVGFYFGAGEAF
jgi:surface antigen Omp85-like protein